MGIFIKFIWKACLLGARFWLNLNYHTEMRTFHVDVSTGLIHLKLILPCKRDHCKSSTRECEFQMDGPILFLLSGSISDIQILTLLCLDYNRPFSQLPTRGSIMMHQCYVHFLHTCLKRPLSCRHSINYKLDPTLWMDVTSRAYVTTQPFSSPVDYA